MNLAVANLKARVVQQLTEGGSYTFAQLARALHIRDDNRLDYVLQDLRNTGQIHFIGPRVGWAIGRGEVYTPMQRKKIREVA